MFFFLFAFGFVVVVFVVVVVALVAVVTQPALLTSCRSNVRYEWVLRNRPGRILRLDRSREAKKTKRETKHKKTKLNDDIQIIRNEKTGAIAWRQGCARRLQSAYRRHKARREFHVLLRKHYAAGLGDSQRRRRFLSGQAAEKAGELAAVLEGRGDSIDRYGTGNPLF